MNLFKDFYRNNKTTGYYHLIIELTAYDQNNNPECEFATYCRLYSLPGVDKKYNLKIAKQKFKFRGEWYNIHDAYGLNDNEEK